jgi:hypothetical protein
MAERAECVMLGKGPFIIDAMHTLAQTLARLRRHQYEKWRWYARCIWHEASPIEILKRAMGMGFVKSRVSRLRVNPMRYLGKSQMGFPGASNDNG